MFRLAIYSWKSGSNENLCKDWKDKRIKKQTEEESKSIEESYSTSHTTADNMLNKESFNIESTLESLNSKCEYETCILKLKDSQRRF